MEEQTLHRLSEPDSRPAVAVLIAALLILVASYNAWVFAAAGSLLYTLALGFAPPLIGLLEWSRLRQRSPEARVAADRLIWIVLLAATGITL